MYKITWDKETGGVQLHSRIVEGTLGVSPRPVFFEELDLLGLDKSGWTYPRVEAPIMWAVNKQYWYRGVRLFDAKGANIYTKPTLEMQPWHRADGVGTCRREEDASAHVRLDVRVGERGH